MKANLSTEISQLPLFAGKSTADLTALLDGAEQRPLKHRDTLYSAGDTALSFALVVRGALKLVRSTPEGHDVIVFFATPGNIIAGLLMPNPQSVYPISAIAMGPATVLKIPRNTYVRAWMQDLEIQKRLNGMFFNRMTLMHDQKAMAKARLSQKIAVQLVSLLDRSTASHDMVIPIPITRQEIADSVGASVESVIRVMSDWSQAGMIETTGQHIHVHQMEKILEVIKGEADYCEQRG